MKTPPTRLQLTTAIGQVMPEATAAWWFGSAMRNEMHSESDIDIAVWLPAKWSASEKIHAHTLLSEALNAPVDILDFFRLPTVMQIQVLETGQLLFAHDPVAVELACTTFRTEYLNIQRWRQPMIEKVTADLCETFPA